MGDGDVVMLLLLDDDLPEGLHCFLIRSGQLLNLFVHVPEHHALDRHSRGGNRVSSGNAGDSTEHEAA